MFSSVLGTCSLPWWFRQKRICLPAMQETQIRSLAWEALLEKGMASHSSILAWRIPWKRRLVGYSSWVCKESDMTEQFNTLLSTKGYYPCLSSWILNSKWSLVDKIQSLLGLEFTSSPLQTCGKVTLWAGALWLRRAPSVGTLCLSSCSRSILRADVFYPWTPRGTLTGAAETETASLCLWATENLNEGWLSSSPMDGAKIDVCVLLPGASLVAQMVKNLPAIGFDPWVRKIPWRREWKPSFCWNQ